MLVLDGKAEGAMVFVAVDLLIGLRPTKVFVHRTGSVVYGSPGG